MDVIVRKLSDWLSTDALVFEFLFSPSRRNLQLWPGWSVIWRWCCSSTIANGTVKIGLVANLAAAGEAITTSAAQLCGLKTRTIKSESSAFGADVGRLVVPHHPGLFTSKSEAQPKNWLRGNRGRRHWIGC